MDMNFIIPGYYQTEHMYTMLGQCHRQWANIVKHWVDCCVCWVLKHIKVNNGRPPVSHIELDQVDCLTATYPTLKSHNLFISR